MIQPHGNDLVDRVVASERADELWAKFDQLSTVGLDRNLLALVNRCKTAE